MQGYSFHLLVTLTHDPVQTWHFYNSPADSENLVKELKKTWAPTGFVCSLSMAPKPLSA